ncbi:MAG: 1,4-alpha-glucan branching protein GlgB [Clostridia bacterium]
MAYHIDDTEVYLFNEGTNAYAYKMMGCQRVADENGEQAIRFAVYAPNAVSVSVVGSFNFWDTRSNPMNKIGESGIYEAHLSNANEGDMYKYAITDKSGNTIYKSDPYALKSEFRPNNASMIEFLPAFRWTDGRYMENKKRKNIYESPMSIYEMHIGSWKDKTWIYDLTDDLLDYVEKMNYTHIELMPISEFPLDESWGYQQTGYFCISSRYGTPEDFMRFVNAAHKRGIGVIIDWVSAHFPKDEHGLAMFDGAALYEHPDKRRGDQPAWGTNLFNYEKNEVRSFLISNAVYFLKEYHVDGLRVDAVSCMLYLNYGKKDGEWLPNRDGGNINTAAVAFLRQLSKTVNRECVAPILIAEESTAFPLVTKPPEVGGLGFNFKWNMGYMNDTLAYMELDSFFRKYNHDKLTFSICYAFSENYILPFSHDEVVHGKRSLINRMIGDYGEKFAQLRLLFSYQYAFPGKKLNFMGSEFGQFIEWDSKSTINFFLLEYDKHNELHEFVRALNAVYKKNPPLYEVDCERYGFEWVSVDDSLHSVIAFFRIDKQNRRILCIFNFTPVSHEPYRLRLKAPAVFSELLNTEPGALVSKKSANDPIRTQSDDEGYYLDIALGGYAGIYFSEQRK